MTQNPRQRRRRRRSNRGLTGLIAVLAVALVALVVLALFLGRGNDPQDPTDHTASAPSSEPSTEPAPPPTTTVPTEPPVVKEASATISAVGDMLMHAPVFNSGNNWDGTYNLNTIFTYFSSYVQSADLALGNLETTLAGLDNGYAYSGYPQFNCPDDIIDSMKSAGFDTILTANNHSYDTRNTGMSRTLEIIAGQDLQYLGTKPDADAPNYIVAELNGIRIGLACYTYETDGYADQKALNDIGMSATDAPLINSFDYKHLDLFYDEISQSMEDMEAEGAEAFVLFLHWGDEYQLVQNGTQSAMAQALCDLGVDVIIGGHPHVVQPVELLTSTTDESQKTVCLYSMGNAVSNQRLGNISYVGTAHTEDGVMFSVTFSKYSDGTVILESAEVLPTWVNLRTNPETSRREYNILPLDKTLTDWKTQFDLTDTTLVKAQESYDRTMAIVGAGMEAVDQYLSQYVEEVEAELGVE